MAQAHASVTTNTSATLTKDVGQNVCLTQTALPTRLASTASAGILALAPVVKTLTVKLSTTCRLVFAFQVLREILSLIATQFLLNVRLYTSSSLR